MPLLPERSRRIRSPGVRFTQHAFDVSSVAVGWKARSLDGAAGFEPANGGIKIRCLTTWRRPNGAIREGAVHRNGGSYIGFTGGRQQGSGGSIERATDGRRRPRASGGGPPQRSGSAAPATASIALTTLRPFGPRRAPERLDRSVRPADRPRPNPTARRRRSGDRCRRGGNPRFAAPIGATRRISSTGRTHLGKNGLAGAGLGRYTAPRGHGV